jgi:glycosyltransferase involved in cell wall biosynthesis
MLIGIDARMYRSSVAGIGRYSQNLIKNLLEIDKKNQYVLFMTPADRQEFKTKNSNVKVVITDIPHYSISEQTKLPAIIAQEKCDLVHFLNFNYPVRFKGKFIVTVHDLTLFFYPETAKQTNFIKRLAFSGIFNKAVKNAQKIIAVSQNTKEDIIKKFALAKDKIEVIYEAADDKKFKVQNSKFKVKEKYTIDNKPIILYVGQFREHKNVKGLLEAYKLLKKKIDCQLALVGKIPQAYNEIIDNDPDLRDTSRPGFVSDEELALWYKTASVFVFPSFYEGFGLPGLEAMQAGTPVVAANSSSLPEVYQDAALYFDPGNSLELSDKIKLVLENQKLRDDLIKKGKKVVSQYSWRKTAQETLKLYQEI